jgi:cytochrome c oxidase assembly protein subunit 15
MLTVDCRLNHAFTLDEFKSIFYMEWGHRVLGRVIGLSFVLPLGYFALRRRLTRGLTPRLLGLAALIGAQGALGWYMVKSGLAESLLATPGAVPRVSQYRLAAHLGTAFVLYAGMFYTGVSVLQDWRFAHGKAADAARLLTHPLTRRFKIAAGALTGLVFLTALSGQSVHVH